MRSPMRKLNSCGLDGDGVWTVWLGRNLPCRLLVRSCVPPETCSFFFFFEIIQKPALDCGRYRRSIEESDAEAQIPIGHGTPKPKFVASSECELQSPKSQPNEASKPNHAVESTHQLSDRTSIDVFFFLGSQDDDLHHQPPSRTPGTRPPQALGWRALSFRRPSAVEASCAVQVQAFSVIQAGLWPPVGPVPCGYPVLLKKTDPADPPVRRRCPQAPHDLYVVHGREQRATTLIGRQHPLLPDSAAARPDTVRWWQTSIWCRDFISMRGRLDSKKPSGSWLVMSAHSVHGHIWPWRARSSASWRLEGGAPTSASARCGRRQQRRDVEYSCRGGGGGERAGPRTPAALLPPRPFFASLADYIETSRKS